MAFTLCYEAPLLKQGIRYIRVCFLYLGYGSLPPLSLLASLHSLSPYSLSSRLFPSSFLSLFSFLHFISCSHILFIILIFLEVMSNNMNKIIISITNRKNYTVDTVAVFPFICSQWMDKTGILTPLLLLATCFHKTYPRLFVFSLSPKLHMLSFPSFWVLNEQCSSIKEVFVSHSSLFIDLFPQNYKNHGPGNCTEINTFRPFLTNSLFVGNKILICIFSEIQ